MHDLTDHIFRLVARQVNARFAAMASHYLFEPTFCNPASGWEKGQVEKNVQDARRQLWQAMLVFRERGYYAVSLADLGLAMKLANGSIYKAFSDKRALFLAAFDRYTARRTTALQQVLDAETCGLDKLRAMLVFYAEASSDAEGRHGCLVVGSAAEMSTYDPEMAGKVTAALQRAEVRMRDLIQLGQADGSIPASVDAAGVATTLLCVLQGLRVVGKVGRTRAALTSVVGQAMRLLA